jgi:hypothetical protein
MSLQKRYCLLILMLVIATAPNAQPWQWCVAADSVISGETNDHPQAFLWIPENCKEVKAVVLTQHNMIEEGMLENPGFRKTMSDLGMAEIWVTPNFTVPFDFHKNDTAVFQNIMNKLAEASGYEELKNAPVIPLGHSALATFPWNFAAWNPARTLAVVSVHGDAPQTNLTGFGRPNVEWENRNIDGVPSLFIMGEYEWWEDRIIPAFNYIAKHPKSVITLFADAGHGHFDYSQDMIDYVCLFIKKAAELRLRSANSNTLKPVSPQQGWLMDRWHKDSLPNSTPASFAVYKGDRRYASWVFDKEMADATEKIYAKARGKKVQYLGFMQEGEIVKPQKSHANYLLSFKPREDGVSFHLSAFFTDTSKLVPVKDHATTPINIERICGPVKKINDTTFQVSFYRMGFNNSRRSNDIWLVAENKGDAKYKSIIQQLNMKFPLTNDSGEEQSITFPAIPNQMAGTKQLKLAAVSTSGLPVGFYVKEGPAIIQNNIIQLTSIPPKAKYPLKVTVVAWQYGIAGKIKSATPIENTFYINH